MATTLYSRDGKALTRADGALLGVDKDAALDPFLPEDRVLWVPGTGQVTAQKSAPFSFAGAFTVVNELLPLALTAGNNLDWIAGHSATSGNRFNTTLSGTANTNGVPWQARLGVVVGGSTVFSPFSGNLNDLNFHTIAYKRADDGKLHMNTDGVSNGASAAASTGAVTSATSFVTGSTATRPGTAFHARTLVYNRALTDAELSTGYATGVYPTDGLLRWRYNEASGATVYDTSGNYNGGGITSYPSGGLLVSGYSRPHRNGVLTFRQDQGAGYPAVTTRTFTATRNLTITKARRVQTFGAAFSSTWAHKRAGVTLASGTWTYATDSTETIGLAMLAGDTLEVVSTGLTANGAVLLFYPNA